MGRSLRVLRPQRRLTRAKKSCWQSPSMLGVARRHRCIAAAIFAGAIGDAGLRGRRPALSAGTAAPATATLPQLPSHDGVQRREPVFLAFAQAAESTAAVIPAGGVPQDGSQVVPQPRVRARVALNTDLAEVIATA